MAEEATISEKLSQSDWLKMVTASATINVHRECKENLEQTIGNPDPWSAVQGVYGPAHGGILFVKTCAETCRAKCQAPCSATKFIRDYHGSGENACVFYGEYSGILASNKMPNDQITGTWLRKS